MCQKQMQTMQRIKRLNCCTSMVSKTQPILNTSDRGRDTDRKCLVSRQRALVRRVGEDPKTPVERVRTSGEGHFLPHV